MSDLTRVVVVEGHGDAFGIAVERLEGNDVILRADAARVAPAAAFCPNTSTAFSAWIAASSSGRSLRTSSST